MLYVATNRLVFPVVGFGLFAAGAAFFANTIGHVESRVAGVEAPVRRAPLRADRRQLPARAVAVRAGRRRHLGAGLRTGARRHRRRRDPARGEDRPHLRGDRQRARADRRGRAAARLPAARRARAADRDPRARLVLQAARHGPDDGGRAAGVRDRRRRDEGDPADRRDAPVRLLRRVLDRRELRDRRAAAADVRSRTARGASGEHADRPRLRRRARAVRAARRSTRRAGRSSIAAELQDNPQNKRALLAQEKIARGSIFAGDGTTLARSCARPTAPTRAAIRSSGLFSQPSGYRLSAPRDGRARAASTTAA